MPEIAVFKRATVLGRGLTFNNFVVTIKSCFYFYLFSLTGIKNVLIRLVWMFYIQVVRIPRNVLQSLLHKFVISGKIKDMESFN